MEARLELSGWFRRVLVTREDVVNGEFRLAVCPAISRLAVCDTEGRKPNMAGLTKVTFHLVGKTEDGRPWFRAE